MNHGIPPLLESFGAAFHYLGWVFREPPQDSQVLKQMLEEALANWSLCGSNERTRKGLLVLQDQLVSWDVGTLPLLVDDFNRLFIGPGPLLAPPWESVHRGVERLLFGPQTLEVRQFYARFGLGIPGREPEDHLGFEFLFMAHLCTLGLEAEEGGDLERVEIIRQALREFLKEHMFTWVPDCMVLVRQHARGPYYRGLADLAEGCLERAAGLF